MSPADWASTASAVFAGASALVAAAAIHFPRRMQNSQEILNQAVLSLERAYRSLTQDEREVQPPAPDRLNWLTAARHLERYKKLKAKLAIETHRTVCEEHEEYWRHKVYVCLDAPEKLSLSYYSEKLQPERRLGIEPRSALVVHEFAKWPEGQEDPIDEVDAKAIVERGEALEGNHGLRRYLETRPEGCKWGQTRIISSRF
jgi:hypothetical protein